MPDTNSPQFWQTAYQNGATAWDLGGPTPVFCRLAENGQITSEHALPPGKMIVPGAGRGYDARLFARHGFTVTAVDFASDAIREMHLLAEPDAPVAIVKADWFDLPPFFEGNFDYVLEYVAYCAINPAQTRRPVYRVDVPNQQSSGRPALWRIPQRNHSITHHSRLYAHAPGVPCGFD